MHEVLVNRLGGLSLPRKSVVRLTDRPDMTLDVYRGRKTTMQHTHTNFFSRFRFFVKIHLLESSKFRFGFFVKKFTYPPPQHPPPPFFFFFFQNCFLCQFVKNSSLLPLPPPLTPHQKNSDLDSLFKKFIWMFL